MTSMDFGSDIGVYPISAGTLPWDVSPEFQGLCFWPTVEESVAELPSYPLPRFAGEFEHGRSNAAVGSSAQSQWQPLRQQNTRTWGRRQQPLSPSSVADDDCASTADS